MTKSHEAARGGNLPKVYLGQQAATGRFANASAGYWTQRTKTVQGPVWEPWYTTLQPLALVEPFAGRFVPAPEIANEESS